MWWFIKQIYQVHEYITVYSYLIWTSLLQLKLIYRLLTLASIGASMNVSNRGSFSHRWLSPDTSENHYATGLQVYTLPVYNHSN